MNPLVVIPTYNERRNLAGLVPRILRVLRKGRVLVVDDASSDGTGKLVRRLAVRYPGRVELLARPGKLGLGSAYVSGFRHALRTGRYDPIIQMDADGSHSPDVLPGIIQALGKADAVVGSRYLNGVRVINWPWYRLALSFAANWYARVVTGVPITDLTGGYNGWRRRTLERVGLDRIRCNGYAFQIELKHACFRRGCRMREVPIVFTGRMEGKSKISRSVILEAAFSVWRMRLGIT